MNAVIFDIDGTLADASHRLHYIQQEPKNWASFFNAMATDAPIVAVCELLRWSYHRARVLVITGRPQSHVHQTVGWMRKHNLPFDHLYMRETSDHRPDTEVKPELFEKSNIAAGEVLFAVEDRPAMCRVWREKFGFTVLQLNDREF